MGDFLRRLLDPTDPPNDPGFVTKVAACAILMELADADGHTALVERDTIRRIMEGRFGIDPETASRVLQLADNAHLSGDTTEDHARMVREMWAPEDRRGVLAAMRDVVWADGLLDPGEERLVWKIAAALGLPFDEVRGLLASG